MTINNRTDELPGIHLTAILSLIEGMEAAMIRLGGPEDKVREESIQMMKLAVELLENS